MIFFSDVIRRGSRATRERKCAAVHGNQADSASTPVSPPLLFGAFLSSVVLSEAAVSRLVGPRLYLEVQMRPCHWTDVTVCMSPEVLSYKYTF